MLITFDDGYLNNWVHAHPVLARHGMRAVLFIITGWIGDGPVRPHAGQGGPLPATPDHDACKQLVAAGRADEVMLRWSEIEAMRAAGTFEFHSHTHTHTRWDKECAGDVQAKRARIADELRLSREALAGRLGSVSDHLCWPQGYFDADYVAAAREPASGTCTLPTLSARTRPARIPSTSTASRCAIAAAPGSTGASGCRATVLGSALPRLESLEKRLRNRG